MVQGSKQYLEVDLQASAAYGPFATQNNGFPAGETNFSVRNVSQRLRGVEILGDGFTVTPTAQRSADQVKANLDVQRPGVLTGLDTNGSVNPVPAPYSNAAAYDSNVLGWLLGASLNKDATTSQLRTYSMDWTTPGVCTEKFDGCKVSSLTIEASEDSGNLDFTSEWIASAYVPENPKLASYNPVFPFALKGDAAATLAAAEPYVGWTFARAYIVIDGKPYASLRSISITVNNNLTPSAPKAQVTCGVTGSSEKFVISEIREGSPSITGNFVIDAIAVDSLEFKKKLVEDRDISIVVLGRHSQSNCFAISDIREGADTASTSVDGTASFDLITEAEHIVQVVEDQGALLGAPTIGTQNFGLYQGGAVMLENQAPATGSSVLDFERDIAVVDVAATAGGVVELSNGFDYWTPVGQTFLVGGGVGTPDYSAYVLFDTVVGLKVLSAKIDTAPFEGGPADVIGHNVSFTASQADPSKPAVEWVTGDPANFTNP